METGRKHLVGFVLLVVSVSLLALGTVWGGTAEAFHAGGVGACEGCHTMHNSLGGQRMTINNLPPGETNAYLLQGVDQSSTCLNCHEGEGATGPDSYHVSTPGAEMPAGIPPKQLSPGGDFGWLKKDYDWVEDGTNLSSPGERHGHNVIAGNFGYVRDSTLLESPGGTYPSNKLHCSSCHDPHGEYRLFKDGKVRTTGEDIAGSGSYDTSGDPTDTYALGVYRLLGGLGYSPDSIGNLHFFSEDPPAALAPEGYNRSEQDTQTRVAYGTGMSEWCGNCHGDFVEEAYVSGESGHTHPAASGAQLGQTMADNYGMYVKSGDLTGDSTTSYWSIVPFEMGEDNTVAGRAAMRAMVSVDDSELSGPEATDNVMCLTCHRAHASGWSSIARWNQASTFLVYDGVWTGSDNGTPEEYHQGRTEAETRRAYYDRPATDYAVFQRSLCNKCHVKD